MTTPTDKQTASLKPFNGPDGAARAKAAGIKSGEVRRANKQKKELANIKTSNELNTHLNDLINTFKRDQLPQSAAAAAQYLIAKVVSGGIEIPGNAVGGLIETLLNMARLEEGQSTSNSVVAHMSSKDALDRLVELRQDKTRVLNGGPTITTGPIMIEGNTNQPET